jgi:hypothetical protein
VTGAGTALVVDRAGVLNAATAGSADGSWQGPAGIGTAQLAPGGAVAAFMPSRAVVMALMVDRSGTLCAASLDTSTGDWQGPDGVGDGGLVPGAPIIVFRQSKTVFAALMIDRGGTLNVASLDLSAGGGWQGPSCVGSARLAAGGPVSVLRQSPTVFTAFMVDRDGTLNAARLDLKAGSRWQGPAGIGNASLAPGSPVACAG